ncbi:MAG: RNA methyltransferase [Candidatus Ranarchaeia archaeon]
MEVIVILVEPEISGNIGAIARTMKNFGCNDLRLVNPKAIINEEARRRAVHANDILDSTTIFPSLESALATVDLAIATTARLAGGYNVDRTTITPKQLQEQCRFEKGVMGLIFGRESSGLTNEELSHANIVVSIPTSKYYPSLNISHAVAILLYELANANKQVSLIKELSTRTEKELLLKFVKQITPHLKLAPYKRRIVHKAFRNLIGRVILSRREANTLLGFFRRIIVALEMRAPRHPAAQIQIED